MKKAHQTSRLLVLILLLVLLLSVSASAAETGAIWTCSNAAENEVTVLVCADASVASGVITVTFDRKELSFVDVTMNSDYILAHAVNSQTFGKVQISWIASGGYDAEDGHVLMQLQFEGASAESISVSGSAYGTDGNAIAVTALDFTALNTALAEVESKLVQDYTVSSFDAMLNAEKEARDLLKQEVITPSQIAAAAEKLTTALAQLEPKAPPTTAAPTEPTPQPNSNGWIGIAVAAVAVCAAIAVAVVVILKKRGNK